MIDNIFNPNDNFLWNHAFNNTYRGNNSGTPIIKQGVIVNVGRQNHLAQTYDVEELETGALFKSCKYLSPMGGFNGIGSFRPLEKGTPVTLGCANGMWDEVFITGVFFTEGNYKSYYEEGNLQKPGDIEDNLEFNQVSGHPNRIVDPTAQVNIYGNKGLSGGFASPEFTNDVDSKAKANPQPGIIELKDDKGNIVNYSYGNNITYTEQNVITVSSGTNETKCNKFLEIANHYNSMVDLMAGTNQIEETSKEQAEATVGIKPIVTPSNPFNNNSTLKSPFEQSYFIEQYRKLAEMHIQQAKACNSLDAARQNVINQMQNNLGSELPSANNPNAMEGTVTKPNYKPKEEKSVVHPNNFGDRIPNKFKPLIVLHETIGNANVIINMFQNPKAEVSYHVMIKLDGTLVNFTDSRKRAYGASPSQFNGEFEIRKRTDGKTVKSVNSFAYHISFETPLDGQTPNGENPTHSGYTEAQYMSAAYQCAKCGVPLERITTHKDVDLVPPPHNKKDPRSFDRAKFEKLFNSFPKTKEIFFDIPGEEDWIKTQGTNTKPVIQTTSDALYKEADKLVTVENGVKLHPDAAEAYKLLKQAALKERVNIKLISGFRSIAAQQKIIDNKRKAGQTDAQIFKVNTKAGYSEHHTGYAFDIDDADNPANLSESFDKTKAYAFMNNNAKKYGFELSYPKGNKTGITYEPWHWRFIGTNTAKAALNLTNSGVDLINSTVSKSEDFNAFLNQIKNKYNLHSIVVKSSSILYNVNGNSSPITPASTIKLIVADLILNKIQQGNLNLSSNLTITEDIVPTEGGSVGSSITVSNCLTQMLKNSTNLETNLLIKNLGGLSQINNLLSNYSSTKFVNYLNMPAGKRNAGNNKSTVIDLTNALNKVYFTSRPGNSVVKDALENNTYKFSYSNYVANKPGFTSQIIGNVGLCNIKNTNYTISIFAEMNGLNFNATATSVITKATQDIINFIKNSKIV